MITEQPSATTPEAGDPALKADLEKLASLKAELNVLKNDANNKNAEIMAQEKIAGITTWDKIAEKMQPVRTAISTAAAKARPVVASAADKVSEKANNLLGRNKEPTHELVNTPEPTTNKPEMTPETSPVKDKDDNSPKELTPEQEEALEKMKVLREELADINRQITNKESEIAWLEKKAGLAGGPLKKISVAMEPHIVNMKHGLGVAKVKTGEQLAKAKVRTKELWQTLAASAGRLKTTMSEKYNNSGSAKQQTATTTGKSDDMYSRYA
eukprot:m.109481 g.109481  ORF g.109481 m.109481 type:complete len:269 (-) comp14003_c2_seq2:2714-3520(-)